MRLITTVSRSRQYYAKIDLKIIVRSFANTNIGFHHAPFKTEINNSSTFKKSMNATKH